MTLQSAQSKKMIFTTMAAKVECFTNLSKTVAMFVRFVVKVQFLLQ
jgi:hypothetical protein